MLLISLMSLFHGPISNIIRWVLESLYEMFAFSLCGFLSTGMTDHQDVVFCTVCLLGPCCFDVQPRWCFSTPKMLAVGWLRCWLLTAWLLDSFFQNHQDNLSNVALSTVWHGQCFCWYITVAGSMFRIFSNYFVYGEFYFVIYISLGSFICLTTDSTTL